jgi:hypothetical protein
VQDVCKVGKGDGEKKTLLCTSGTKQIHPHQLSSHSLDTLNLQNQQKEKPAMLFKGNRERCRAGERSKRRVMYIKHQQRSARKEQEDCWIKQDH